MEPDHGQGIPAQVVQTQTKSAAGAGGSDGMTPSGTGDSCQTKTSLPQ